MSVVKPYITATIDRDGYPHVTPIWFIWQDGRFYLTSYSTRPHVRRCIENPRCGLVVDSEYRSRSDCERPYRDRSVIELHFKQMVAVASL